MDAPASGSTDATTPRPPGAAWPNQRIGSVMAGSFIGLALSAAGVFNFTVSLFLKPMTQEFGWSRAAFFLPLTIGGLVAAVITPAIGALADRHGPRRWLLFGATTFGLITIAMALVDGSL